MKSQDDQCINSECDKKRLKLAFFCSDACSESYHDKNSMRKEFAMLVAQAVTGDLLEALAILEEISE